MEVYLIINQSNLNVVFLCTKQAKKRHDVFSPPPPPNTIKEYFIPILLGLSVFHFFDPYGLVQ